MASFLTSHELNGESVSANFLYFCPCLQSYRVQRASKRFAGGNQVTMLDNFVKSAGAEILAAMSRSGQQGNLPGDPVSINY